MVCDNCINFQNCPGASHSRTSCMSATGPKPIEASDIINLNAVIKSHEDRIRTLERLLLISINEGSRSSKEMADRYKALVLKALFNKGQQISNKET